MKGQLKAASPAQYLDQLHEPRRADVAALDALIRKTTRLDPYIHSGILAYGPYHYKYASGREGDWFRFGVSSNKNYISLYVCAGDDAGYVAERYRDALPNASIGRSCVRFKRLSDLDPKALQKMLREASRLAAKA
jgi:hypothetical protein